MKNIKKNIRNRKAFSMIELIFVIVILGILAGVAVPKMMGTRTDAYISKAKSQIASIKNGINTSAATSMLSGGCSNRYPVDLNDTALTTNAVNQKLFGNVLKEPIISSNSDGGWLFTGTAPSGAGAGEIVDGNEIYTFRIEAGRTATFQYYKAEPSPNSNNIQAGTFYCSSSSNGQDCLTLTK